MCTEDFLAVCNPGHMLLPILFLYENVEKIA